MGIQKSSILVNPSQRIGTRLIIAVFIVVMLPLIGTGLYGNLVTSQALTEKALEASQNKVRVRVEQIEGYLDGVHDDVLYLSGLDSLRKYIAARVAGDADAAQSWRDQLEQDFFIFSNYRPQYYQVRYIAEDGMEVVRVDSDGSQSTIIPEIALQNKVSRYYFTETLPLSKGDLYVSPLDLNVEHGQIEVPYKPVIRYATPVYDHSGVARGIVVINVFADRFLQNFYQGASSGLAMADQQGYYLAHQKSEQRWGGPVDLGTGFGVKQDYPHGWKGILSKSSGIWESSDHVVVHQPVYPAPNQPDYYWIVMDVIPRQAAYQSITQFRVSAVIILLAASAAAFVMTLLMTRQITAPILRLREGVEHFTKGELNTAIPVEMEDEVGELTSAFNEMAATLRRNLEQLRILNRSGQAIAAGLDRRETLQTALESMQKLFQACYFAIILPEGNAGNGRGISHVGDDAWYHAHIDTIEAMRAQSIQARKWQAVSLPEPEGGFYCCAPFRLDADHWGLLSLYGDDRHLAEASTGNLLQTLAYNLGNALENVALYESLSDHRQRLKALVERLISVQEEERKLVAFDIHDGLLPYIVSARLQLSNALHAWESDPAEAKALLDLSRHHLTTALGEGRRIIDGLRPGVLDDLGLVAAVRQLLQEMAAANEWEPEFFAQPPDLQISQPVEVVAFRIIQEALSNVQRHALADQVKVNIQLQDGSLILRIKDDGRGFDLSNSIDSPAYVGLVSQQERAALLGGKCMINSQPGQGTEVIAILPREVEDE